MEYSNNSVVTSLCTALLLNMPVEFSSIEFCHPEIPHMLSKWWSETAAAHLAGPGSLWEQPADEGADSSWQRVVQHRQTHLSGNISSQKVSIQSTVLSTNLLKTSSFNSVFAAFSKNMYSWENWYFGWIIILAWSSKQVGKPNKNKTKAHDAAWGPYASH